MKKLLAVALVLSPFSARAAGFALGEQSAVAGGTAGAGAARADDPAAAWYAPASVASESGWQSSVGLLGVSPSVEARALDGSWSNRTRSDLKTPPAAYLSWAGRGRALGVSVNVPFGSGVSWPGAWQGRYEIVSSSLQVIRVAPFAAIRRGNFGFAVGPQFDFGEMKIEKKLDMIDTEGDVAMDMTGVGAGAHASIWWEPSQTFALGLTAKSRTVLALNGAANFHAPDAFSAKAPNQRVRTRITTPDLVTLGLGWRASHAVRLLADIGMTNWSVHRTQTIDFANESTTDVTLRPRWNTTVSLRAGGELATSRRLTLRGGFLIDPSPAPERTLSPTSPDANRAGATAGFGVRLGRAATVDAFYEYLRLLDRRSTNPDALQASYRGQAHMIGLGIRWAH